MNLYYNDCDYVVAEDEGQATVELAMHIGGEPSEDSQEWRRVADDKLIGMWCGADQLIAEPESDGATLVKRPAREWVERFGRGYIGSTEW